MTIEISKLEMRRFLLTYHGLIGEPRFVGKEGILEYVKQVGCIQFDPIDVCGKSPELTVHAHVHGAKKEDLYELLYHDRHLVDYFDKNLAIFPVEDWPYFEHTRQWYQSTSRSSVVTDEATQHVLEWIHKHGAVCSKDIKLDEKVDWYWGPTSLSRATLERLYFQGKLVIHHKKGTIKYYALASDHVPESLLLKPHDFLDQYHLWHVLRRIKGVGALWCKASDAFLGISGFKAAHRNHTFAKLAEQGDIVAFNVTGIKEELFVAKEDYPLLLACLDSGQGAPQYTAPDVASFEGPRPEQRLTFIAPLDAMIWDRNMVEALWGFNYRWEIYTPESKRRFGYYVLPMVYGTDFVGRIEIVHHKKAHRLEVKQIWFEPEFEILGANPGDLFSAALDEALERFKVFHGCHSVIR